ncbi:hypothetical protein JRQ81_009816 [Phrynocephalus forsythii]|uniref:Uncharacterized protein n=1 Tax=Phrynocephalus forsythii TaxID=171643 RepID=A0A9Q0X8V0_9SAUR|nr:hypothetical protein JRQ81_009816 [Phrynocephalus forsythii]
MKEVQLAGKEFSPCGRAVYPSSNSPAAKMARSSPADEGTTFEHLWSTLEPDSTYFDLPQSGHMGGSEASNRREVTMDVFQMRSMNDSVMRSADRSRKQNGVQPSKSSKNIECWAGQKALPPVDPAS